MNYSIDTIVADEIVTQLAAITATSEDGEHLLVVEPAALVLLNLEKPTVVSLNDAAAFLIVGGWSSSHSCSEHKDCVRPEHVADPPAPAEVEVEATVTPLREDEEDALVRAASRPTLASLYKNARSKGLVPASPASGASGYF